MAWRSAPPGHWPDQAKVTIVSSTADVVVVGAGVVGLALADAWLTRYPSDKVVVVDKEELLAQHASGRNSGVLHAGFYYAPDSLKAQLTQQGNALLREFCVEEDVPLRETGKVVVTQSEAELPALMELFRRGQANGVELELIDAKQLAELEPLARTTSTALWSPSTGVANPGLVVEALAKRVTRKGGQLILGANVTDVGSGFVSTSQYGRLSTGHIINAAGLYADVIAHQCGVGLEYRMLPFKGLYWYGSWAPGQLQRHVYPVPDARNPFLGVHLTVTVDGLAKIGPTAIPALWREDYGGFQNFDARESWGITKTFPRFLTSREHDVPSLLKSEFPKYSRRYLINKAAVLVPSVDTRDFKKRGKVGVRAQLFHLPSRKLEMDFVIRSGDRSTHILNAVSPGWTSALSVANYVLDTAFD